MDTEEHKLLDATQSDYGDENETSLAPRRHYTRKFDRSIIILLLLLMVVTNGFWFLQLPLRRSTTQEHAYYGIPRKIHTPFDFQWFDFDENSRVFNNDLWTKDLPESGGMVALTSTEVAELNLEPSIESPDDPSKQVFFLAAYHHVHCLILMKDTIMSMKMNTTPSEPINWGHMFHCMDALRQAAWCNLDTTILRVNNFRVSPSDKKNGPVDGQAHVCTNRHALKAWAENHAWIDQRDGVPGKEEP